MSPTKVGINKEADTNVCSTCELLPFVPLSLALSLRSLEHFILNQLSFFRLSYHHSDKPQDDDADVPKPSPLIDETVTAGETITVSELEQPGQNADDDTVSSLEDSPEKDNLKFMNFLDDHEEAMKQHLKMRSQVVGGFRTLECNEARKELPYKQRVAKREKSVMSKYIGMSTDMNKKKSDKTRRDSTVQQDDRFQRAFLAFRDAFPVSERGQPGQNADDDTVSSFEDSSEKENDDEEVIQRLGGFFNNDAKLGNITNLQPGANEKLGLQHLLKSATSRTKKVESQLQKSNARVRELESVVEKYEFNWKKEQQTNHFLQRQLNEISSIATMNQVSRHQSNLK